MYNIIINNIIDSKNTTYKKYVININELELKPKLFIKL